ncbi:MAG: glycosyltransferase [Candidatus Paceibacterota bacterium]|jgi:glycosyltransferase involved in cell wall biosynthesis|nr:glycosyltransferase [Candidatus Paceibacterota bacterium]
MSSSKKLRLLFISTDREIFREGSEVRERMTGYASIAEELKIIVFAKRSLHLKPVEIAPNSWAYPTNSISRWFYISGARRLADRLYRLTTEKEGGNGTMRSVEKIPLDLISTQDPFECGLAGYFISKKYRVPLHLQIHTDFLNPLFMQGSHLNFIRRRIARFLFREHANIRAVSERIKASVFKKMSFRPNAFPRIEVFPVFVDRQRFKDAEDTVHLHQKYPGFDVLLLAVSRLEKEKNVEGSIRLVAAAMKRNPEAWVGLVIVGDGSQKKYLQNLARSLHVSDRVFFEGAVLDPAPFYKSADALLVTSHFEGYGRQMAESVAAGCMVIARDVGAANEIVTHSSGIVCEEDDDECLLHNILLLANDRAVRDQLKNSAKTVADRAVWETKEQYLERYRQLLEDAASNEDYLLFL